MSQQITLKWIGPYTYKELIQNPDPRLERIGGVYLRTDMHEDVETLTYVGKSEKDLLKRQSENYRHFIGGMFSIRQSDGSFEYKNDLFTTDETNFFGFLKEAYIYTRTIKTYFAPMKMMELNDVSPEKLIKKIEDNLLWVLQPTGTKKGTKTEPKDRLDIKHDCSGIDETRRTTISQILRNS